MPGVKNVTVHSVHSNTLRDAKNMNLLVQSTRSIVCFANLIYANRINSHSMSRVFCDLRSQKTPRGILPVNSNQHFLLLPATCNLSVNYVILLATGKKFN